MEQTIAFLREGVAQCSCCQTPGCNKKSVPVVAIVGPGKSSATIAVQNLLQVFRIPQIGYSATTPDLSDKEQFGYFMRVVPSDVWQAQAINRLLHHYNWTYIAVLYSAVPIHPILEERKDWLSLGEDRSLDCKAASSAAYHCTPQGMISLEKCGSCPSLLRGHESTSDKVSSTNSSLALGRYGLADSRQQSASLKGSGGPATIIWYIHTRPDSIIGSPPPTRRPI
ncbi:unnamed protein product [Nippostrongylus brasiliensis]|uniref:ANF_receptor domain-containing protein n=1 Tax=Nippostrongylus brasiliensis TaxID=27835 RepID=A0A0N4XT57_NIPBR|nr:unnamed protein product [Nippostrongylus brasiliensis]